MLRNIYLKGEIADVVGKSHWQLVCTTPAEAITGIDCQRNGKLLRYFRESLSKGVNFTIQRGENLIAEYEANLSLGNDDLIITPVPSGSRGGKKSAFWGTILAIIGFMMGDGGATSGATQEGTKEATKEMARREAIKQGASRLFIALGTGMVQRGLAEMALKDPQGGNEEGFFNGPASTVKQGTPVPILYGRLEISGAVGNFGFTYGDQVYTGGGTGRGGGTAPGNGTRELK